MKFIHTFCNSSSKEGNSVQSNKKYDNIQSIKHIPENTSSWRKKTQKMEKPWLVQVSGVAEI
jgi:hypothetical protein